MPSPPRLETRKRLVLRSSSPNVLVLYSLNSTCWKLSDFGFTSAGTSKQERRTWESRGTASYRAPELLKAEPKFTNKVDIWALGCLIFELVTGTKAFKSDQETVAYLNNTSIFVPEKSDANAVHLKKPAGIEELLTKCLSIRPEARPRAIEVFHEVERLRNEVNLLTEDEDTLISSQAINQIKQLSLNPQRQEQDTLISSQAINQIKQLSLNPKRQEHLTTRDDLESGRFSERRPPAWDWLDVSCLVENKGVCDQISVGNSGSIWKVNIPTIQS